MNQKALLFCLSLLIIGTVFQSFSPDWGFFGHKRINKLAVFTLPSDLILFYKKNIDFITEHAADPDKRRYASKFEAIRHYIDIDHWGAPPFNEVPRKWLDCMMAYTDLLLINENADSTRLFITGPEEIKADSMVTYLGSKISMDAYRGIFITHIMDTYYEDERKIKSCDFLKDLIPELDKSCTGVVIVDHFSSYGILPYHLLKMQGQLTKAFESKNLNRVLRLSTEMGHYLGDAHVPLHTTENYNGQLSDQLGIHAFWESRIPELFADDNYDYFVGPAVYIDEPRDYFWKIILDSHELLAEVLANEKRLSQQFPEDQQLCFEDRKETTIKTQCRAYAEAYSKSMNGMVEERMRQSIHAIGSCWYTAWVDAGQPKLEEMEYETTEAEDKSKETLGEKTRKIFGRSHDN